MFWKSTRLGGLEGKMNGVLGVDTALSGTLESIPIQSEVLTVCLAVGKKALNWKVGPAQGINLCVTLICEHQKTWSALSLDSPDPQPQ